MQNSLTPLEYKYYNNRPFRSLFSLLNRPRRFYVGLMLTLTIKHSPMWAIPFLTAQVIDTLSDPATFPLSKMMIYFGVITLLIIQNIPSHTFYISMLSGAVRDLERTLRSALVTRFQQLSMTFHDRTESGRLQAKVLRDVEQVQMLLMLIGEGGLIMALTFIFTIVTTALREPRMLGFFALLVPMTIGLGRIFRERINQRNTAFRTHVEQMSAEVSEMINMIPVDRAHGLEQKAVSRIQEQFGAVNTHGRRLDIVNAFFTSSSFAVFQLSMVLGLLVMTWSCRNRWITVGEVVLYQSLFSMLVMSVSTLLSIYPQIAKGMESLRSIGEVLECPDLELNQGRISTHPVNGNVEFEHVTFGYNDEPVVNDVSLNVHPGECIALVGASGAGKSTLTQLLIGFRRPQHGRILFDGQSMEELDMRKVRRFISVVPQETLLFSGSIRENILYGLNEISSAQLHAVLNAANLTELVDSLPEGLETRIGEDGAFLSGGQRQRIAIARALIRNPKILVLDEATSALDVVSEKKVQEAIDRAVENRTTFIVAHRLSTIRKANRIVVMNKGRIAEIGSYDELMAIKGLFAEMQQLQH